MFVLCVCEHGCILSQKAMFVVCVSVSMDVFSVEVYCVSVSIDVFWVEGEKK